MHSLLKWINFNPCMDKWLYNYKITHLFRNFNVATVEVLGMHNLVISSRSLPGTWLLIYVGIKVKAFTHRWLTKLAAIADDNVDTFYRMKIVEFQMTFLEGEIDTLTLVYVMACRQVGNKSSPEPMSTKFPDTILHTTRVYGMNRRNGQIIFHQGVW